MYHSEFKPSLTTVQRLGNKEHKSIIIHHYTSACVFCCCCFCFYFYFLSREYVIPFLRFPFQVIELIDDKAEDDDDCYELQNILSDPHVAVCAEINCEP